MRIWSALLAVLAVPAAADETVPVRDASGKFALEVPASWETEVVEDEHAELLVKAKVADIEHSIEVAIYVLHGQRDARAQAYYERRVHVRKPDSVRVDVRLGPPPFLVVRSRVQERELINAFAYSMVRRNGVNLRLTCGVDDWPLLEAAFLTIARSVRADVPEWPAYPSEFRRTEHNGYVWFVHPDVNARAVRGLKALVRRVERRFEKAHGAVTKDPDNRPFIVACNHIAEARKLEPTIGRTKYGAWVDYLSGSLFLTPLPRDAGPSHASAAKRAWQLLHVIHYGDESPLWMCIGERELAWSEERTGAQPPRLNSELVEKLAFSPPTLKEVWEQGMRDDWPDSFVGNAAAYVLLFRAGPPKYRRAYAAFRKDLWETRNITGSMETHLLSLDAAEMRADIADWLNRAVEVARKK